MKSVKVTYKVKPEYVETNKSNIKAVMDYLAENPIEGMVYSAYLLEDGQTFMHINVCDSQETMDKLMELALFNDFRKQLMASEPIESPKSESIEMIA